MKGTFFRKKNTLSPEKEARRDRMASRIAKGLNTVQCKWAGWMQRHFNPLSDEKKWIAFFCFCVLTAGFSGWCIIGSFSITTKDYRITRIQPVIRAPVKRIPDKINRQAWEHIQQFRHSLDSLVASPSGKPQYDSIVQLRPGLIDSIKELESIYQTFK